MTNIFLYALLMGSIWTSVVAEVSVETHCQAESDAGMDCIANYANVSRLLSFLPVMLNTVQV